jgi:DivIVA domain-containing protein
MSVPSTGHDVTGPPPPPMRQAPPMSPERVRTWEFSRSALGRRGYNADEVRLFLARLAEELAAGDREKSALRAEVRRLRNYYRDHNVDLDGSGAERGAAAAPPRDDAPTIAAINLMSQAQQAADAQVAQAEEYARRLVHQAREQYEEILREAAEQASEAAERAGAAYLESREAGVVDGPDQEALERRIAWLRTFAEVTQVQLKSVLEALTREVDKLGDLPQSEQHF